MQTVKELIEVLGDLETVPMTPPGYATVPMMAMQYHQLALLERLTIAVEKLAFKELHQCCEDPIPCKGQTSLLPRLRDVWPEDWDNVNETEDDALDIGEVVIAGSQEANPKRYALLRLLRRRAMDCVRLRDVLVVGRAYLRQGDKVKAGALHQLDTIMEEHGAGSVWQQS